MTILAFHDKDGGAVDAEQAGIVLRLGLFFDGTGNNKYNSATGAQCRVSDPGLDAQAAADLRQRCRTYGYDDSGAIPDTSYGCEVTNIARLYDLYPDQSQEPLPAQADHVYVPVYLEGIGTSRGQADSAYSQGTGQGSSGVLARVKQAPALVLEKLRNFQAHNPARRIHRIEVDLFGFSRGAAAARHCANDLLKGPESQLALALPAGSPMLTTEFAWHPGQHVALNFIGLFDTVAGIVAPLKKDFSVRDGNTPGLDLCLAPGTARQVVHLVAEHEYRHNFSLNGTENDLLVPGCHSDVGGGYFPESVEKVLLSKPDSGLCALGKPDQDSEVYRRTQAQLDGSREQWQRYFSPEGLRVALWGSDNGPHQVREGLPHRRVFAAIEGQRPVRGELSLVYLRIMRELGVRAGVAFHPLDPEDGSTALPDELHAIGAKLLARAVSESCEALSDDEQALLLRRYIHLSAHWNGAMGWNNSNLDVMFVNRPAKDNLRMKHRHESPSAG